MSEFGEHYWRGLGMSARNNALAYGYSVTATASFGMLAHTDGPLSVLHVFMFVVGSGIAFAGVNALVTRGYRQRVEQEPPVVTALASSFAVVSVSAAVALTTLLGWAVGGWLAWLLGAVLGTWLYLSISAAEMALSRTLHLAVGDEDPEKR
jgi:hypothetical protein